MLQQALVRQALERFEVALSGLYDDVVWQRRSRGLMVPADGVEVVADVLLVEVGLGFAGRIPLRVPETARVRGSTARL